MTRFIYILLLTLGTSNIFAQLKARPDTNKPKNLPKPETFTVPEIQAKYPGGFHKMSQYFLKEFTSKVTASKEEAEIFVSPVVAWTVDESGEVVNPKIIRTSNISRIDQQLAAAVKNMPQWAPAKHNGQRVKQDFQFPTRICFK